MLLRIQRSLIIINKSIIDKEGKKGHRIKKEKEDRRRRKGKYLRDSWFSKFIVLVFDRPPVLIHCIDDDV